MAGFYPDGKGKPGRKPKFRPRITRIKLNPEQAVLFCECFSGGRRSTHFHSYSNIPCTTSIHICYANYRDQDILYGGSEVCTGTTMEWSGETGSVSS